MEKTYNTHDLYQLNLLSYMGAVHGAPIIIVILKITDQINMWYGKHNK